MLHDGRCSMTTTHDQFPADPDELRLDGGPHLIPLYSARLSAGLDLWTGQPNEDAAKVAADQSRREAILQDLKSRRRLRGAA